MAKRSGDLDDAIRHHPSNWDEYLSHEQSDRMSLDETEPDDCPFCGHELFFLFDGITSKCTWCGSTVKPRLRGVGQERKGGD